ncbi:hypothetical protein ACH5AO_04585 [Streptomyces sp. NPDC018964]|uniref:hypothetical protein n=1 Tax=Streptomyces sp. NPDC018964 TaxID=3365058 RepID=UPI0037B69163
MGDSSTGPARRPPRAADRPGAVRRQGRARATAGGGARGASGARRTTVPVRPDGYAPRASVPAGPAGTETALTG